MQGQAGDDEVGGEQPAEVVRGEPDRFPGVGEPGPVGDPGEQGPDVARGQHFLAGPRPAGEQVRQRFAVGLLVRVIPHRQRHLPGPAGATAGDTAGDTAGLGAALHRQQRGDQVGAHRDEAFGVGLGRDDVQQRHQRVRARRGVVPQRQLGELEQLLDPDAGVPQRLDDRPGPEPVVFEAGDVDPAVLGRHRPRPGVAVHDLGPELGGAQVVVAAGVPAAGEPDTVDDELLAVAGGAGGVEQPPTPVPAGGRGRDERRSSRGASARVRAWVPARWRRLSFAAARDWVRGTGQGATQMPQRAG